MPQSVVPFQIRMPPPLHDKLASWASKERDSINNLIVGILEKAVEGENTPIVADRKLKLHS